jgi:hypothetical protein
MTAFARAIERYRIANGGTLPVDTLFCATTLEAGSSSLDQYLPPNYQTTNEFGQQIVAAVTAKGYIFITYDAPLDAQSATDMGLSASPSDQDIGGQALRMAMTTERSTQIDPNLMPVEIQATPSSSKTASYQFLQPFPNGSGSVQATDSILNLNTNGCSANVPGYGTNVAPGTTAAMPGILLQSGLPS